MKRRTVAIMAFIVVIGVASVSVYLYLSKLAEQEREVDHIEHLQGKYNATITVYKETYEIGGKEYHSGDFSYVKDGKNYAQCYYDQESRAALDWIKANTSENAVFLSWWDYGHMIVGIAERETIVTEPSRETLYMIANPDFQRPEFSDHGTLVDVAEALATSNETETVEVMEKYGADYLYISDTDRVKCWWFFNVSGREPSQYISERTGEEASFTDEGKATMIYKLLFHQEYLSNFTMVYQDEYVKIYKLNN